MSQTPSTAIAVIGIDIGKNSFHVVGHDTRGTIVLRQKWSRGQVEARLANMPPCLIGMEACVGAHHLSRKLASLGHDVRLMPAKYVRPYPTRAALGDALRRLRVAAVQLTGASDHGGTEVIYLRDPDGNCVELYWDRPEKEWPRNPDGSLHIVNKPLNIESLAAEGSSAFPGQQG